MCKPGCLCSFCCDLARDFSFRHWDLDQPHLTMHGLEPPMVSYRGHWYDVDGEAPLDVFDDDGYLYAVRAA